MPQRRLSRRHDQVVLAWIHPGSFCADFTRSVMNAIDYDRTAEGLIASRIELQSGPRIAEARSQVVEHFLDQEGFAHANWLLMLDSDMVFDPELPYQLLLSADPQTRPVMGGLCVGGNWRRSFPTVYRLIRTDNGTPGTEIMAWDDLPESGLVKVGATGAACLLVHRNVLDRMRKPFPYGFGTLPAEGSDGKPVPNPFPWFFEGGYQGNVQYGEDVAFCMRLQSMGIPVHVDMDAKVGHVKTHVMWPDEMREAARGAAAVTELEVV